MEFYIGKVFNLEEYANAYNWLIAQNNEYYSIKETNLEDNQRMFVLVDETPAQEEFEQQEKERIAKLYLTGADVERGIYQAKGMDFDDIIALVEHLSKGELDLETGEIINKGIDIDVKALKIELKANHFYRGNPYVNAVGALLGFTSEQLDKFFETKDYTVLLPPEPIEPEEEIIPEPVVDNPEEIEEENQVITETEDDEV